MQEEKRVFDYDRSKIILSTINSTINGPELCRILREEFHLETEMTTENYVLAMAAVGDTKEGFTRLCQAVEEIDKRETKKISQKMKAEATLESEKKNRKNTILKQIMTISNAMDAPCQISLLEESAGKISAEFVYLYPPGIPLIVPGEQITGLLVRNVRRYMEQGLNIHGLCGENNEMISVVKEQAEV